MVSLQRLRYIDERFLNIYIYSACAELLEL